LRKQHFGYLGQHFIVGKKPFLVIWKKKTRTGDSDLDAIAISGTYA